MAILRIDTDSIERAVDTLNATADRDVWRLQDTATGYVLCAVGAEFVQDHSQAIYDGARGIRRTVRDGLLREASEQDYPANPDPAAARSAFERLAARVSLARVGE